MPRHPLPAPGVVLGQYPERISAQRHAWLAALCGAWWDASRLTESLQQKRLATRCARLRQMQRDIVAFPGSTFRQTLNDARAHVARDGLASEAALRCAAHVSVAIRTTTGLTLRDSQIMAALAVLDGRLAELPTGGGKTLATALAAATAALAGVPVHVITANDYLAQRDAELLRPLYRLLGLSVGAIAHSQKRHERGQVYGGDVVYCSAKEIVFDYLRDRIARADGAGSSGDDVVQGAVLRGLCMAIVDEADSVLIDEAATPFVLAESRAEPQQAALCELALSIATRMNAGVHYRLSAGGQRAELTVDGCLQLAEQRQANASPLWAVASYREQLVETALHALHGLQRDVHYFVKDGKVMLIDANTGRAQEGRAWSRGLHQMVEIKEACALTHPNRVLTQITFQGFFNRYLHLAGLSGTLAESRRELLHVYDKRVMRIPTSPSTLQLLPPQVFAHAADRWRFVIADIAQRHARGQAVLVGTDSVADSERLSRLLTERALPHCVLNARQDRDEARLIALAGRAGVITVATNIAGRGTDIAPDADVIAAGGLHVLSCQHNSARRIDRQLFGRAARQGQPGSAQTVLSLEEGLLHRHLGNIWCRALQRISRASTPLPIWLARALIWFAQSAEERRLRDARSRLREQDARQTKRSHFGIRAE